MVRRPGQPLHWTPAHCWEVASAGLSASGTHQGNTFPRLGWNQVHRVNLQVAPALASALPQTCQGVKIPQSLASFPCILCVHISSPGGLLPGFLFWGHIRWCSGLIPGLVLYGSLLAVLTKIDHEQDKCLNISLLFLWSNLARILNQKTYVPCRDSMSLCFEVVGAYDTVHLTSLASSYCYYLQRSRA